MYRKLSLSATAAICALLMSVAAGADEHPVKDSIITAKVKSELVSDFGKRAAHIHVTSREGVVALTGEIDSADARNRAERDAKRITGVVDVIDKLEVK